MSIERPVLKFKKLDPDAIIPQYATDGSAGFDLYSIIDAVIESNKREIIPTGIAAEIPEDWCILFIGKSGLASREGVAVLGGLIDPDYRGGLKVIVLNTGEETLKIKKGDKITQGVLLYAPQANIIEVKELTDTKRGTGGFGSTGK